MQSTLANIILKYIHEAGVKKGPLNDDSAERRGCKIWRIAAHLLFLLDQCLNHDGAGKPIDAEDVKYFSHCNASRTQER